MNAELADIDVKCDDVHPQVHLAKMPSAFPFPSLSTISVSSTSLCSTSSVLPIDFVLVERGLQRQRTSPFKSALFLSHALL